MLGFIGLGNVGKAIYDVFFEIEQCCVYDIKIEGSRIEDVLGSDIVFLCLPTLPCETTACDLSIIDDVMEQLHMHNYNGIICIKSTVIPETTANYIEKYNNPRICFCPEFLRERYAYSDFKYKNPICIIGTVSEEVFEKVKNIHSMCDEFRMVLPSEAEITKYFQNVYNTQKILFANAFYEICKKKNIVYNNIIRNLEVRGDIDSSYLLCDENLRGPSGSCLVKDTLAFHEYVKKQHMKPEIFNAIIHDMELYPKTMKIENSNK